MCWNSHMHSLLSQRHLTRQLRHLHPMGDRRIPKEILYGQLGTGVRKVEPPALRFKDARRRDLKAWEIDPNNWEYAQWSCLLETDNERRYWEGRRETSSESWGEARSPQNSSTLSPTPPPPTSRAACAVETATRALAYKATQDVAPLWIDKGAQACLSRLRPTTTNLQRPTFIMWKFNLIEQRWRWKTGRLCNIKKWVINVGNL